MKVYSICILGCVLLLEAYLVSGQAGELAAAAAGKAADKPPQHPSYPNINRERLPGVVGGAAYDRQRGGDWSVGGGVGVGVRVYEKGGHSIGVGAGYSQAGGRNQGNSWKSRPDYGVGVGYQYRWGK